MKLTFSHFIPISNRQGDFFFIRDAVSREISTGESSTIISGEEAQQPPEYRAIND